MRHISAASVLVLAAAWAVCARAVGLRAGAGRSLLIDQPEQPVSVEARLKSVSVPAPIGLLSTDSREHLSSSTWQLPPLLVEPPSTAGIITNWATDGGLTTTRRMAATAATNTAAMPILRSYHPPAANDDMAAKSTSTSQRDLLTTATGPIQYHGGYVLTGQVNVYIIYVGYAQNTSTPAWLNYLVGSLQGSPWWRTMTRYYSTSGNTTQYVSGNIQLAGTTYLAVVPGTPLDLTGPNTVYDFVSNAISHGYIADDKANGIYAVIPATSSDILLKTGSDGFCYGFCGWHARYGGTNMVLVPQASCTPCRWKLDEATNYGMTSPSGDPSTDAMASTLAHEIAEAVSDPVPYSGWAANNHEENGDLCSWIWGNLSLTLYFSRNTTYNVLLGQNVPYIIQQMWDPDVLPGSTQQVGCVSGLYDYRYFHTGTASNKCIGIRGSNQTVGQALVQWDCLASTAEEFNLVPTDSNFFNFKTTSGLCIGVAGGSTLAGTDVGLWTCNGGPEQQFGFYSLGNYTYAIKPRHTLSQNMCLNIRHGSSSNGARLQTWGCNSGPSQQFMMYTASA